METKRYMVSILLQVEVEAFNGTDAIEAVQDTFGVGNNCGLEVMDYELTDFEELD